MKTALQEMLEWTRKTFPMDLDTPRLIEDKIESLLELEKEDIIHSYLTGSYDMMTDEDSQPQKYYNQRYYNQNK